MSDYERCLERIEEAAKNGRTELDLGSSGSARLPPEIGMLTKLTSLTLRNSELTGLPPEIARLANLTRLIDSILNITDCDLLVGIFWKRFGTPTADGKTGTEHEFGVAYEAWTEKRTPQIFVYFNSKPYAPKSKAETEQWGQVLEFREKFPKEGLWWPYAGKAQFEKLVRNHLTNYIRNLV